ncbi:nucleotidyltransferase domain-containing protein [Bacillus toyonensis]|uniref:nucleotidyltransferase domain-containing protein n=1 Tax=Bacillus toyonensis TaxID=155322 RepID=UPI000BEF7959|nr:aminoglycoside adenylyltransferase domain-containing protein [Bacillus toyonensis]PEJ94054.1 nucleotidyltransferase [Bacillus toyonensis]PEK74726.1 nucleotidyltransferase [Bacillus toyonensis]PFY48182.1 nucleotidyltransferase [Bacillus toyonensis]PFY52985.1 nucleotidyltransferase [Bacillus toyonensis]PFY75839.1 nucleotidyltransferase [Bacillus toyonensis]
MFTRKSRNIYKAGSLCEFAKAFFNGGIDVENGIKQALPAEVKQLMEQYIVGLKEMFLDGKIVGVYVYGSIALGAFHIETSDVDFVAVLNDSVNEAEKQQIVELHKKMSESTLGKRMDGMYIPLADLGKYNHEINEYVYCADGKANIGHWDINAVTWWTLKNQGITVIGKEVEDLPLQIKWDDVVNTMQYNVEQYWSEKAKQPYLFFIEEWVESAVVTMGRILYTLDHKTIVSKDRGLQYLLERSAKEWEPLLKEVERMRYDPKEKKKLSIWRRADMTKRYLLSLIEECRGKW